MRVIFENEEECNKAMFDKILASALKLVNQDFEKIVCSVSFISKEEIHKINAEARNVDRVTDVLSFPLLENLAETKINPQNYPFDVDFETGEISLGDILICTDVAHEQATEYGHSYERELHYLFTHAVFHLLGFDHLEEADKAIMRANEEAVLNELNITRD